MIDVTETASDHPARASIRGRDLALALGGLLLAIGLAVVVSWGCLALILLSGVPRFGRIAAVTIGLGIGAFQVIYLLPIQALARRSGAKWFNSGIQAGALIVLTANVALWVFSFLWPSPQD